MSDESESAGAAIVCDLGGVVRRVAHDRLGLGPAWAPGASFVELLDQPSAEKASAFLEAVRRDVAAFDWQLCAVIDGRIALLHCSGFSDARQIWIVLARTQLAAARVLEGMSLVENEQTGMLRAALKYVSQAARAGSDDSQFQDLTALYNQLGVTQRELAQRNAELEAVRAALERKQAELVDANATLEALASTDGLTGIANRRAFGWWLDTQCKRAAQRQTPLSLAILDIDRFKSLNDTFGHQAGDEILRLFGRTLAESCRANDFVARYGGEEFALVLTDTDAPNAMDAAERLRARIEAVQWPHRPITASIGVASRGPDAPGSAELIREADRALYFSKTHGRNRVTHATDAPAENDPAVAA